MASRIRGSKIPSATSHRSDTREEQDTSTRLRQRSERVCQSEATPRCALNLAKAFLKVSASTQW
jgi:hypothetical protein